MRSFCSVSTVLDIGNVDNYVLFAPHMCCVYALHQVNDTGNKESSYQFREQREMDRIFLHIYYILYPQFTYLYLIDDNFILLIESSVSLHVFFFFFLVFFFLFSFHL